MLTPKTLTYSSLIVTTLVVIFIFLTASTYTQLAVAIALYIPLAYYALKVFPRPGKGKEVTIHIPPRSAKSSASETATRPQVEVADIDKRAFLKIIGATGLSVLVFSLLGRRIEPLLFGQGLGSGVAPQPAPGQAAPTGSPLEGYKISEIDDDIITYYGFINPQGAWMIMREDTDTSSFRYAKGDTNFPASWARRETLKYDYFHNLF